MCTWAVQYEIVERVLVSDERNGEKKTNVHVQRNDERKK